MRKQAKHVGWYEGKFSRTRHCIGESASDKPSVPQRFDWGDWASPRLLAVAPTGPHFSQCTEAMDKIGQWHPSVMVKHIIQKLTNGGCKAFDDLINLYRIEHGRFKHFNDLTRGIRGKIETPKFRQDAQVPQVVILECSLEGLHLTCYSSRRSTGVEI